MLAASLPFARRIGVGRRRFVQQPAKVDEMGMRRRPFFEFGSLPFSDELIGGHRRGGSRGSAGTIADDWRIASRMLALQPRHLG
jgi:hypothetical protein